MAAYELHQLAVHEIVKEVDRNECEVFLAEALMLSLVGGLIGIAAGVGGSWLFGQTSDMRTVIVPSSILLAFSSAALVGIFFGFFPANKAAQLDPIQALRHE